MKILRPTVSFAEHNGLSVGARQSSPRQGIYSFPALRSFASRCSIAWGLR